MKKQVYFSPEVGVAPLYLSACIMSGIGGTGSGDPENPDNNTDPNAGFGAPKRKVF